MKTACSALLLIQGANTRQNWNLRQNAPYLRHTSKTKHCLSYTFVGPTTQLSEVVLPTKEIPHHRLSGPSSSKVEELHPSTGVREAIIPTQLTDTTKPSTQDSTKLQVLDSHMQKYQRNGSLCFHSSGWLFEYQAALSAFSLP